MNNDINKPSVQPTKTRDIPVVDEAVLDDQDLKILDIPILTTVVDDKAKPPTKRAATQVKEKPDTE